MYEAIQRMNLKNPVCNFSLSSAHPTASFTQSAPTLCFASGALNPSRISHSTIVIILHSQCTSWLFVVQLFWIEAKISLRMENRHWKPETIQKCRMCLRVGTLVSCITVKITLFSSLHCQGSSCRAWVKIQVFLLPLNLIKLWDSFTSGLQHWMPLHRHPAGKPNSHIFAIQPSLFHKSSHRSSFVT